MLEALLVALCSAGYLLMVLCCLFKRDSAALAARMRTERIMATLDMEECPEDATLPATPLSGNEPGVSESDR